MTVLRSASAAKGHTHWVIRLARLVARKNRVEMLSRLTERVRAVLRWLNADNGAP